ncbi:uncharacterized protein LOC144439939 [Glandiceps talaboti]
METQSYLEGWIPATHDNVYLGFKRDDSDHNLWSFYNFTTVTHFNWAISEPLDLDCVVMSKNDGYRWKGYECDGGASYLCQYVMEARPFPKYIVKRYPMTASEAENTCHEEALHAKFPSVRDQTAYDHIQLLGERRNALSGQSYFVDLKLVNGNWVDSDSNPPEINAWMAGEPQPGKECVVISSLNSYQWQSVECMEEHKVVCEFPCGEAHENWCKHGDIVIENNKCICQCWSGSFGTNCEDYDYNDAIHKLILFYESQRSGYLPDNNRIPWRHDSALNDVGIYGEDLVGGWYDAGDQIKVTFKHAQHTWIMAWGLLEFKDAYAAAGELEYFYDCLKWGVDYIVKLHTAPNVIYAHIADPKSDHSFWGRPEEMTMARPAYQVNETHPGTDVAGNAAAALAASYMVFKDIDPTYADELLVHARQLYDFANNYRGKWADAVPEVGYKSGKYDDELANGALWLYRATGEQLYLDDAVKHYNDFKIYRAQPLFSREKIQITVQLGLYLATNDPQYAVPVEEGISRWFRNSTYTTYTPWGLAVMSESRPLKKTGQICFVALVAAKHGLHTQEYLDFAQSQIHYILGDTGRSFLAGFGRHPPTRNHHRASSCPDLPEPCTWQHNRSPQPNPQILFGGLVCGPDVRDNFYDDRKNYLQTESGINSSGFLGAIAGLAYFRDVLPA